MSDIIKVVVDAMGGDNAPQAPIKGAIDAVNENDKIHVVLVGRTDDINTELAKYKYDKERVTIVHADDVIGFDEPPVMAIRKKKNSSIVVGMNLVRQTHLYRQEVQEPYLLVASLLWVESKA